MANRSDSAGRSVLLTGATGGIGRELATRLAARGDRLILVGRDGQTLASMAEALHATHGADVAFVCGDLGDPRTRAELVSMALERQVDVLINNAGQPGFGALASLDDDTIARVIAINLTAPLQLMRAMIGPLSARPDARILNVGSALGHIGLPGFSLYSASKFGLRGAGEALRRELADTSIKIKSISPRTTSTGFNAGAAQRYNDATGAGSDTAASVARAIVAQLDARSIDRVLGFPERLFAKLNALMPSMLDGGFRRHRQALAGLPNKQAIDAPSPRQA
ncbi:MAG: SDR family oxidoreductase [Burkholderiaceae bacterium]